MYTLIIGMMQFELDKLNHVSLMIDGCAIHQNKQ
jgi:hypothetical protein